jgi:hypothetical protein
MSHDARYFDDAKILVERSHMSFEEVACIAMCYMHVHILAPGIVKV